MYTHHDMTDDQSLRIRDLCRSNLLIKAIILLNRLNLYHSFAFFLSLNYVSVFLLDAFAMKMAM